MMTPEDCPVMMTPGDCPVMMTPGDCPVVMRGVMTPADWPAMAWGPEDWVAAVAGDKVRGEYLVQKRLYFLSIIIPIVATY